MADNGAPKEDWRYCQEWLTHVEDGGSDAVKEHLFYTKDMTDYAVDQASFSSIVVF